MKKSVPAIILLLALAASAAGCGMKERGAYLPAPSAPALEEQAEPVSTACPAETVSASAGEPRLTEPEPPALEDRLAQRLEREEGSWSLYFENLSTGQTIAINDGRMVSASLIKLFIMGEVYAEMNAGRVGRYYERTVRKMITESDNMSANILVAMLGGGEYFALQGRAFQTGLKKVNDFAAGIGCTATEQQRDMLNSRPVPVPEENYTSAADCGRLLSMLYQGALVSPGEDSAMLEILKQQHHRGKIPAGLPEGTECANKTGELDTAENDAAIVFSPGGDYVLCIISNGIPDKAAARAAIAEISAMVYDSFNPGWEAVFASRGES